MDRQLVWYSIHLLRDFDTFAELVIASGIVQWAVIDEESCEDSSPRDSKAHHADTLYQRPTGAKPPNLVVLSWPRAIQVSLRPLAAPSHLLGFSALSPGSLASVSLPGQPAASLSTNCFVTPWIVCSPASSDIQPGQNHPIHSGESCRQKCCAPGPWKTPNHQRKPTR